MKDCDNGESPVDRQNWSKANQCQAPDLAVKFGIETLYTAPSDRRLPGPLVEYT